MSTSVGVRFLSNIFKSLHILANLALSIIGAASLPPKAQKSLKTASKDFDEAAIMKCQLKLAWMKDNWMKVSISVIETTTPIYKWPTQYIPPPYWP